MQLGYFDNDLPHKVAQGSMSTTFTLDVAKRRLVQSSDTGGEVTTTTRHYTDSSDNPSWIETKRPDGTTETLRYTSSISGDLGASIATDGGVSLMLPNIHGDIATTIPIPAGTPATTPATTITGWSSYTEYGTPIDPAQTATVGTSAGYGWLGAKERSTTAETANLTLMGVRFYNRTTGAFTSVDPVPGGNNTAYNYPTDPINQTDTDGAKRNWQKWAKRIGAAASFGSLIPGPIGMIATTISVGAFAASGCWKCAAGAAVGFIPGAALASKAAKSGRLIGKVARGAVAKQAKMKGIGVNSRLFGYHAKLNKGKFRIGWSNGRKKEGIVFRGAYRNRKLVTYRSGLKWNGPYGKRSSRRR